MLRKLISLWQKDREGTAAIEFSLLALPFVLTVICIIEMGIYFANAFVLESSVIDAARIIKTGALQQSPAGDQETLFADAMCRVAGSIINCDDIQYEVRKLDGFSDDLTPAFNDDGDLDEPPFNPGNITAGCTGLIRAAYRYEFITPFFGRLFGSEGNTRLLLATTVFRTEPYNFVQNDNCSI